METQLTVYPNGHDSTEIPDGSPDPRLSDIQTVGAGTLFPTYELTETRSRRDADVLPGPQISTDDLYTSFENVSTELSSAIRLLSHCLEHIDYAVEAQRKNNIIEADDAIQRLQGLLPELFCCRSLGDGFGLVVNAVICGFQNQAGNPLGRQQIEKLRQTIAKLRNEPFMRDDEALKTILVLEEVGFVVEPPEFEYLADVLDE